MKFGEVQPESYKLHGTASRVVISTLFFFCNLRHCTIIGSSLTQFVQMAREISISLSLRCLHSSWQMNHQRVSGFADTSRPIPSLDSCNRISLCPKNGEPQLLEVGQEWVQKYGEARSIGQENIPSTPPSFQIVLLLRKYLLTAQRVEMIQQIQTLSYMILHYKSWNVECSGIWLSKERKWWDKNLTTWQRLNASMFVVCELHVADL